MTIFVAVNSPALYGAGYVFIGERMITYGGFSLSQNKYFADMWVLDRGYIEGVSGDSVMSSSKSGGISTGAIVAAVIVPMVVISGVILGIFLYRKKRTAYTPETPIPMETFPSAATRDSIVVPETEKMQGVTIATLIGSGNFGNLFLEISLKFPGEVFRGTWHKTPVALKKIKKEFFSQFQKEFDILISLKHPVNKLFFPL
jgi:hypothetical protein